jgi:hypothetical protein
LVWFFLGPIYLVGVPTAVPEELAPLTGLLLAVSLAACAGRILYLVVVLGDGRNV